MKKSLLDAAIKTDELFHGRDELSVIMEEVLKVLKGLSNLWVSKGWVT